MTQTLATQQCNLKPPSVINREQLRCLYTELLQKSLQDSVCETAKKNLLDQLNLDHNETSAIIASIEQVPALQLLLDQDARILEGYSIREHTSMVLDQFNFYLSNSKLNLPVSKPAILAGLLFHDLGKSLPDEKSEQHIFNVSVIRQFKDILPMSENELEIILSVIQNDVIGKFVISCVEKFATVDQRTQIREKALIEPLATAELIDFQQIVQFKSLNDQIVDASISVIKDISNRAQQLGITAEELFNIHVIFYQADTAAYTYDSCDLNSKRAHPGLDFLYQLDDSKEVSAGDRILVSDPDLGILQFGDEVRKFIQLLRGNLVQ
jgi:hypothetical protein